MTSQHHVLPAADRDLDDQADYLAREASLETALRFYDAAEATFRDLARMPGTGELREPALPRLAGLREFRIKGFENPLVFTGRPTPGSKSSASCMGHAISTACSATNSRYPAQSQTALPRSAVASPTRSERVFLASGFRQFGIDLGLSLIQPSGRESPPTARNPAFLSDSPRDFLRS